MAAPDIRLPSQQGAWLLPSEIVAMFVLLVFFIMWLGFLVIFVFGDDCDLGSSASVSTGAS